MASNHVLRHVLIGQADMSLLGGLTVRPGGRPTACQNSLDPGADTHRNGSRLRHTDDGLHCRRGARVCGAQGRLALGVGRCTAGLEKIGPGGMVYVTKVPFSRKFSGQPS